MTETEKQTIATAYLRARASKAKDATPESVLKIEAQRAKELDPNPNDKGDAWYFTALPEPPYIAFVQRGEEFSSCTVLVGIKGGIVEMVTAQCCF